MNTKKKILLILEKELYELTRSIAFTKYQMPLTPFIRLVIKEKIESLTKQPK